MSSHANYSTRFFTSITIPQQKAVDDKEVTLFPLVLSPSTPTPENKSLTLLDLTAAVKEHKSWLDDLLHAHGAILFRGFNNEYSSNILSTASDFNDLVEAFGYEDMPYLGGAAPRFHVMGRVYTANESPPDRKISFHHELIQVPEFPSKIFFFCEIEPGSGGETPIVLSHIVYAKMKEKYPEFIEKLEKHRLTYTRVLGEEDDPSSPIGRGWKSTFLSEDKSVAEERAAKMKMKLEWLENGNVKTIMGPLPAFKYNETRQCKIWFNSIVGAYTDWADSRNDPTKAVTFGDGNLLPGDIVRDCVKILEEESVAIPWKKGDVLLIDNLAVLHSRRFFSPPRRILVSLCK